MRGLALFGAASWATGMLYELALSHDGSGLGGLAPDTGASFALWQGWYPVLGVLGALLVRRFGWGVREAFFAGAGASLYEIVATGALPGLLVTPAAPLASLVLAYYGSVYGLFVAVPAVLVDVRDPAGVARGAPRRWHVPAWGAAAGLASWVGFAVWMVLLMALARTSWGERSRAVRLTPVRRWRIASRAPSRLGRIADWLLGAALALMAVGSVQDLNVGGAGALPIALALLQTLPVVGRRRWPVVALAVASAALAGHYALGYETTAGILGAAVCAYQAGSTGQRPHATVLIVAGCISGLAAPFLANGTTADLFFTVLGIYALPWLVGGRVRRARLYTAQVEERAERAEAEQAEAARRAARDERARLARELHDIVSHAVSVTVVQAGAASRALAVSPERAGSHVQAIERAGRQAMGELRRLLGVLRDEDAEQALAPPLGVADLGRLVGDLRAAGLAVEHEVEGASRPLPTSLDVSVYRIAQEALTNVLRHAPQARATLTLAYPPGAVEVRVRDDGRAPVRTAGDGHGLVGMRERVALFDGTVTAGPHPSGGFEVRVVLPDPGEPK